MFLLLINNFDYAYQAPETLGNPVGAVPLLSYPGTQPPWASEVGQGLWQGSEGLLQQGSVQDRE